MLSLAVCLVSACLAASGMSSSQQHPPTLGANALYIAMNRFQVNPERWEEFEHIWLERETHLQGLPGFVEFHMLRGPEKEDHVLYASHTIWRSREDFEAWTHSEAFRAAHANAGQSRREGLYLGPPTFEGFEVIQTIGNESGD